MAKKKKETAIATVAPKNLAIARSGSTVAFTWTIGDADYDVSQNFYWSVNGKNQRGPVKIDSKSTSQSATINLAGSGWKTISFGVQGERKKYKAKEKIKSGKNKGKTKEVKYNPTMSDWSIQTVNIIPPDAPIVGYSRTASNAGTFSWSVPNVSDSGWNIFHHYEWQHKLFSKWPSGGTAPTDWSGATTGSGSTVDGSVSITEDSSLFNDPEYSYTRWFRARSVGMGGTKSKNADGWVYTSHTYARPKAASISEATAEKKASANGYTCNVKWTTENTFAYPIETGTIQYKIDTPDTTSTVETDSRGVTKRVVSWSCPSDSWSNAGTVQDNGGDEAYSFSVDENVGLDKAMFARIITKHDDNETESHETFMTGGVGYLRPASNVSVTYNTAEHKATINAVNNSDVADSFIVIYFRKESNPGAIKRIGILRKNQSSVTVQCPDWGNDGFSIGTQTMLADYSPATPKSSGVTEYTIDEIKMEAEEIKWEEGAPLPPKDVYLKALNASTIQVTWGTGWTASNQTELSWADHQDAWESTNEPSSYIVSDINANKWNIAGLGIGTWYVRARHVLATDETTQYSVWSDIKSIRLSSAPAIPALTLSSDVVTANDEVTCYWGYVSTDGSPQMQASVCEVTVNKVKVTNPSGDPWALFYYEKINGSYIRTEDRTVVSGKTYYQDGTEYTYGNPFLKTKTAQHATFKVSSRKWKAGEVHYLAVKVVSGSLEESKDWSTPVPIMVAKPLTCTITASNALETAGRSIPALRSLPLIITVSGGGTSSVASLRIERSGSYPDAARPDESEIDGFDGETICHMMGSGEGSFTITKDDLIGHLDNHGRFLLVVTVVDSLGQKSEAKIGNGIFEVDWTHTAIIPHGSVDINDDYYVAILRPFVIDHYVLTSDTVINPDKSYYTRTLEDEEYIYEIVVDPIVSELSAYYEIVEGTVAQGDTCDIYRLSIDKPELIYKDAIFGERYVDPYPTIGSYGGYRFVYKTFNGDFVTSDRKIAWYNTTDSDNEILDEFTSIINFGAHRVSLPYNLSLSNKWSKDFIQTNYLGGHVQGDWNPAVTRSGTITTVGIVNPDYGTDEDVAVIEAMRRLAVYSGVCHVRTPDGSSYSANINVSEDRESKMVNQLANYSLEITKVDSEGMDGITYQEWIDSIEEEE